MEGGVQVGEEEAATGIHQDVLRLDVAVDVVELHLEGGRTQVARVRDFQTFFELASTTRTFCRSGRGGTSTWRRRSGMETHGKLLKQSLSERPGSRGS